MIEGLRQFVPQDVCLFCWGCCRFKEKTSVFRPKMSMKEIREAGQKGFEPQDLCESTQEGGYLQTICSLEGQICVFLQEATNTCRIYAGRPLECQLYPFMLTRHDGRIFVSVHLACPFVQKQYNSSPYNEYVDYLRSFFAKPEVLSFVQRNQFLAGDYSSHFDEFEILFAVDFDQLNAQKEKQLLEQKPLIEKYLRKRKHSLSAFSFASIFLWKDFFDFHIKEAGDNLFILASNEMGSFLYLPPLGEEISPRVVEGSLEAMEKGNPRRRICRIENIEEGYLDCLDKTRYSVFQKAEEYIYLRKDIAGLVGNKYKSKRALYNFFVKNYRYEYCPFKEHLIKECMGLYDQWAQKRSTDNPDGIYRHMLKENRLVHRLGMERYLELGLVGRVVFIDGDIKAYTFGFELDRETFCVLFEIADVSIKGLPVFIFREFCRDKEILPYQFINVMDDFGMENVRKTKVSFRPFRQIPSYVVSRKDKGA